MTVQEAVQSIVSLAGVQNVCACQTGGGDSLINGAITSLNRAMQEIWASPTARAMLLETVSVTFATATPQDMPADVLNVVGPVRWNGYRPIPLAATATEFNNYFLQFADEPAQGDLFDTVTINDFHDVSNSTPYWPIQLHLPLWDDRAVLIWFDDEAGTHSIDLEAGATAGSQPINRRLVSVRVVLPTVDTDITAAIALIVAAINRSAGEFLEAVQLSESRFRIVRRRAADLGSWNLYNPVPHVLSITAGPRVPAIAWAEELKAASGNDLAHVRLHLLPAATGTATLLATKEPPRYTMPDLDCDGGGAASTVIKLTHQWVESVALPLARLAYAQDHPAYLSDQTIAGMAALEAAAQKARETLGRAAPGSSQMIQRNQTTEHAHP